MTFIFRKKLYFSRKYAVPKLATAAKWQNVNGNHKTRVWNSNIKEYTSSYIGYKNFDYYIPLIRYSGKSNALKQIKENICKSSPNMRYRKNGFLGMDKEWNTDLEKAQKKENTYEINIDLPSVELFEKFINECKTNNIKLILVYAPEYIGGQKFVSNRNELIQTYKNFSTKYALDFYDYSMDSLSFEKKYFYNASHLNKIGAEIFTKKLASKLKARKQHKLVTTGQQL